MTTPDEKSELDKFLVIEHIMRLAKAKAHQYIHSAKSDSDRDPGN